MMVFQVVGLPQEQFNKRVTHIQYDRMLSVKFNFH